MFGSAPASSPDRRQSLSAIGADSAPDFNAVQSLCTNGTAWATPFFIVFYFFLSFYSSLISDWKFKDMITMTTTAIYSYILNPQLRRKNI